MGRVEKLHNLAMDKGLDVLHFEFIDDMNHMRVVYHRYSKAGRIPIKEHCRDAKDYELLMIAWRKAGTVYSPEYKDFDSMILGELKRLKHE
jgi:hypothetical protein